MMKEVFRASSPARVNLCRSVLENAGISCFVRNETAQQSIPGGLAVAFFPLPDFWPTLCVMNDGDYSEAMMILNSFQDGTAPDSAEWKCARCGESVPGNFTACWSCETPRGESSEC